MDLLLAFVQPFVASPFVISWTDVVKICPRVVLDRIIETVVLIINVAEAVVRALYVLNINGHRSRSGS